jgi:hypothetical protein
MTDAGQDRTAAPQDSGAAEGNAMLDQMYRTVLRYAAIRALVSVGCPEQLRDGPLSVTELASRCGADAPALGRLLRSAAQTGLLRLAGPGSYELTGTGQALLGSTALLRLRWASHPEPWNSLGELTETVRTGRSPLVEKYGSTYDFLDTRPEAAAAFDALMVANHSSLAAKLAEAADFAGLRTLVDVGGGRGTFLAAILRAHAGLRGTLLELERAVPAAKDYLDGSGAGDRSEVVAGDFFVSVPAGADAYLLANVIHNWDDESAVAILRTVRAAMTGDSRVLLVEIVLPDDDSPHPGKDLDVRMLSMHSGQERTRAEYEALLREAGLEPRTANEIVAGFRLLTASAAQ